MTRKEEPPWKWVGKELAKAALSVIGGEIGRWLLRFLGGFTLAGLADWALQLLLRFVGG